MNILDQFRKRVTTDSESEALALLERGKQLLESHFYDRSMIEFSKAMQLHRELASQTVAAIYQDMLGSGDLAGLISVGSSLLAMNPENVELANAVGNLCRQNGDWNQALSLYEHCLRINPKHLYASYNLPATIARVELSDSVAIQAIKDFEQMDSFRLPDYHSALPELWELHHMMVPEEEYEEDEEEYEEDEETDEEYEDDDMEPDVVLWQELYTFVLANTNSGTERQEHLLTTLGLCCLDRKVAEVARQIFDQLSERDPKDLNLRCFWFLSLALSGKEQEAIDKLVQLLGKYPNHRYANVNLGFLYRQINRPLPARRHYFITHRLLQRSQGYYDIEDCLRVGNEQFERQNFKKALEVYQPLIPEIESVEMLNRIGHLYLEQRNLDDAYKLFQRSLRKDRKNQTARQELKAVREAYLQQVEADLKKSDWKAAAHKLEQAIAILPTVKVLQQLLDVCEHLEDWKRHRELEKKIRELQEAEAERQQQLLLERAIQAEVQQDFKLAMSSYEQALRILPKREVFLRMVGLSEKMGRAEMVPRLTNWFNQVEEDYQRQQASPPPTETGPTEATTSEEEKPKRKRKRRKRKPPTP